MMRRAKPTLPASLLMTLSVVMALLLLGADLASAQGTATIRGHIYTGATRVDGTPVLHSEDAGLTPPITTAKVMVQNQHSGGAFIAYATVDPGTNFWHASVPVPGDYVVMFSAPGHDATSREFAVALDGEIQEQDAYLPKLFASPFDPAVPSTDKLPRAGFLMYVFYENQINGEDDAPDDPPLNGATVWAEDEDGNVLATGISGIGNYALPGDPPNSAIKTLPFPGAPGGLILTSIDGLCYFDNLPPTEVMIYTDASTAYLYDVDGPLSLGPVPNLANRDPITNEPIPLDFAPTSEFYLLSSEEGGVGFEAVLYPGDPGLEDGGYLGWHGYVPKLGQIGSPTNPTPFDPGTAGSIETILNDADMAFDVLEPEDALVQIMHPGVTANTFVPDAFVVLATDDETLAGRAVATAEPYYWDPAIDPVPLHPDGYVNLENVPPGRYKLFACDSPIDYVYIKMQVPVPPNTNVFIDWGVPAHPGILIPRFFARVRGHVYDNSTIPPTAVPGATVNIRYKGGAIHHTTTTDASGWYNFDNMPEIEVLAYVEVELPPGFRGSMVTDTYYPNATINPADPGCNPSDPVTCTPNGIPTNCDCVILGAPYTLTHNGMNRYVQWFTANYEADLYIEPIPPAEAHVDGFLFNDHLDIGTWTADGIYDPHDDRTLHGIPVELWDATGTTLLAAITTGAFVKADVLAQGWHEPYTIPPDEWGGVFAGPLVGYYEFREADYDADPLTPPTPLLPGTYMLKIPPIPGFSPSPLVPAPVSKLVTVLPGGSAREDFGFNTTPTGSAIGVPLAGEIEGGVFDDVFIDYNCLSTLFMEKAGIPHTPVGVYDHLGYRLGIGYMGNPYCNAAAYPCSLLPDPIPCGLPPGVPIIDPWCPGCPPGTVIPPPCCPDGEDPVQKPEMERRFAPGPRRYVGNDPTLPGYNPNYIPLMVPYTFGQGKFKFEADWSLIPAAFAELPFPVGPLAGGVDVLPEGGPVIATVDTAGPYVVTGENFGDIRGYSTLTQAGRELSVISWTDTQIEADAPADPVSGPLLVTTWTGPSNAVHVDVGYDPAVSVFVDAASAGGDGSQGSPYATIAEALANLPAAAPGTTRFVFVAAGMYGENVQIAESDVHVIGAGPLETTVQGQFPIAPATQGVMGGGPVFFIGAGGMTGAVDNVMISGLTVTRGSIEDDIGCGIFGDYGNTNLDINTCVIAQNGGYYGGAIWLHYSNHNVSIWSNSIAENGNLGGYSGGISVNDEPEYPPGTEDHGEPEHIWDDHLGLPPPGVYEIYNNHIFHNFSPDYGAGISLYEIKDHLMVLGNLIEENWADDHGGAVFFEDTGPIDLGDNVLRNNACRDDGGAVSFEDVADDTAIVLIYNNEITGNIADDCGENHARGGGLAFDDTFYVEVFNNTISDNIVAGSFDPAGGGIDSERNGHEYNGSEPLGEDIPPGYSDPMIYNNIIANNWRLNYDQALHGDEEDLCFNEGTNYVWEIDNIHVDDPVVNGVWETQNNSEALSVVEHNDFPQGEYPGGVGNIFLDPQFVDAPARDYRLAGTSPAINQAPALSYLSRDIHRFFRQSGDGVIDMGAYEYSGGGAGGGGVINPESDCNGDGIPDVAQLAGNDCNNNHVPDECETDCDANGTPDDCDLAGGAPDCNADGVPDSCQLVDNDCNLTGIPDDCEISSGFSQDCNTNGVPDDCDIGSGLSLDCNSNGIPDSCEGDCNANGIPDDCDLLAGSSEDCNSSGIPDECEGVLIPVIVAQPANTAVCPGGMALISVSATSDETLSYQWRKDGVDIAGATGPNLAIFPAAEGDAGIYDVQVSTVCDTILSDAAILSILSLPIVDASPADQSVCVGQAASFNVSVSGTPPFTYQWQQDGVDLPGETGSSLTIDPVAAGDAGSYGVVVSNFCGDATSAPATLSVSTAAPGIVQQPQGVDLCDGESYTMSVIADGSAPLSYQWLMDGVDIPGATSSSLSFPGVTPADTGAYTVVITNLCGTATSTTAFMDVYTAAVVTSSPASQQLCAGEAATFSVSAAGTPPFSYQWRLDGVAIPGATGPMLTIDPVTLGDSGSYDVVVSNSCGQDFSVAADLLVDSGPSVTAQPTDVETCAGDPATFSIIATGTLPLSYQWRLNGVGIPGATASELTLGAVTPADAGSYDVVVTNLCGNITSLAATLTVDEAPAITAQPVSQSECEDAAVTFTVAAGGTAPLAYQWRLNGVNLPGATLPGLTIDPATPADAGDYDVVVSNLCGSATSALASLTVTERPDILVQPIDTITCENEPVLLTAEASGDGPLGYQWRRDGVNIPGATSDAILIDPATPADSGVYDLVVTNFCGPTVTDPAVVTVLPTADCDCNGNGAPDSEDIATGISEDCNGNGQPDECDLAEGSSIDTNSDGVPDECEQAFMRGDANGDTIVDIADVISTLSYLFLSGPASCLDASDFNDSGAVDIADAMATAAYIFNNGVQAPPPFLECGLDPTPDAVECDSYGPCGP